MKIAFYTPDGSGDKLLVAAVMGGAARHGDEVKFIPIDRYDGVIADADAVACYGVRASTRIITEAYRRAGKRSLYFDKGYCRGVYTRVAVDAWQPTKYFRCGRSSDRLAHSGIELKPWRDNSREQRNDFIYAATTQTWCDFYDLGPARALDEVIVRSLIAAAGGWHGVVYRPRPAYAKKHPELCKPIEGAKLPVPTLAEDLERCFRLFTLGSNAAVEALAAGVPVSILGADHPCRAFDVGDPLTESDSEARRQFFADLAYTQWTLDEYHSGVAWADIKETMRRTAA